MGFLILSIAESTYPCSEAKAGTMSSNSDWALGFKKVVVMGLAQFSVKIRVESC